MQKRSRKVEYIGETGREFGIRRKEHLRVSKKGEGYTEVSKHSLEKHGKVEDNEWKWEILDRVKDDFERKVRESYRINEKKPVLNISDGIKVVGSVFMRFGGKTQ